MAKHKKTGWQQLTDLEKHHIWVSMNARQRVGAWEAMGARDRRMIELSDALATVRALGLVPRECGPAIINAPARGRLIPFMPVEVRKDAKGSDQRVEVGYRGRHAARVGDVWDLMEDQARRSGGGFLFDAGQVAAGRDYAALMERCNSSGLSGTSLEVLSGKAGAGSVSEAVHHDMERLRDLRLRIGPGLALEVRRVRPSVRGKRVALRHVDLVDMVCVGQMSVVDVLLRSGWAKYGDAVRALRRELCASLDRMRGAAPRYRAGHQMQKQG